MPCLRCLTQSSRVGLVRHKQPGFFHVHLEKPTPASVYTCVYVCVCVYVYVCVHMWGHSGVLLKAKDQYPNSVLNVCICIYPYGVLCVCVCVSVCVCACVCVC